MKIEIVSEKKVPILSRKEVQIKVLFSGKTPSNADIKGKCVEAFKSENVIIKKIRTEYGQQTAVVSAFVYDNSDAMKKIEIIKPAKKDEKKE